LSKSVIETTIKIAYRKRDRYNDIIGKPIRKGGVNLFSETIKENLRSSDMSIYELSKKSEVAYATLHNIISGKSQSPRVGTLIKIAKALDEPLQNLIGGAENEKSDSKNQKNQEGY
jgi:lambda repressor-like predicted transcriptional regulator